MVNQRFEFLFNRLSSVEVTTNQSLNFELYHYLCEFEFYVYGIFLQYNRIKEDLKIPDKESFPDHDYPQKIPTARLDIYYYTMTWDKLKKVYGKFNNVINRISIMPSPSSANSFKSEYKNWRKRIEHLFLEFGTEIRNEYEHPSLEFYKEGNLKNVWKYFNRWLWQC